MSNSNHRETDDDLKKRALSGDADAQYELGMALWANRIEYDDSIKHKEFSYWLRAAADQGHVEAQYQMGEWYEYDGNIENEKYLHAAAEEGHGGACMELSNLYMSYVGDEDAAVAWYRRGRECEHPHDLSVLLLGYSAIKILPGSKESVVRRVLKKAKKGYRKDQLKLADWYIRSDNYPVNMNLYKSYAWYSVAFSGKKGKKIIDRYGRNERWSVDRGFRILKKVLNDKEMRIARRLAMYYELKISSKFSILCK